MTYYSRLLKDPKWQRKRLEILNRDNWQCQRCSDKEKTLHVHHKWYEKNHMPWEYPDNCLITLCENCHQYEGEDFVIYSNDLIKSLKKKGMMADHIVVIESALNDYNFDVFRAAFLHIKKFEAKAKRNG